MNGRDEMLNEAIAKAKEAEDWQLVEWLRAARGAESAARWYTEKLRDTHRAERKLMNENAKLRELIADLWEYIHIGTAQDGQSLHDRTRELGVEV